MLVCLVHLPSRITLNRLVSVSNLVANQPLKTCFKTIHSTPIMASKKQRTLPAFELLYHPTIPGRGEYIRLLLEATGTPYSDIANEKKDGYNAVLAAMDQDATDDGHGNPVAFAPPMLRVPGAGKDGKSSLLIHQTPTILAYLGPLIGMAGEGEVDALHVSQIAHTALDLSNEVHDTHHPIAVAKYYEDQKDEAVGKAADVRGTRIPKYFSYFERLLKGNQEEGKGKYLLGTKLSYADTTVWQVIDG